MVVFFMYIEIIIKHGGDKLSEYGDGRVSSIDQNEKRQMANLKTCKKHHLRRSGDVGIMKDCHLHHRKCLCQ